MIRSGSARRRLGESAPHPGPRTHPCSDRSVRELKGPDRPVFDQDERAEILAALRHVDYVVIFDDVSPRSLIGKLLPDVLVKGGDYQIDEIHGREEVEAAGGKVIPLPFVPGASTTSLLERMRKK